MSSQITRRCKFCDNCGWNFNYKKNNKYTRNRPEQRRWQIQNFQNSNIDEISQWLDEMNGNIEIIPEDIQGALQYHTRNFGISYEWECSF